MCGSKKRNQVSFRSIEITGDDRLQLALEMRCPGNQRIVLVDLSVRLESDKFLPDQYPDHRRNGGIRRLGRWKILHNIFQKPLPELPENLHYLFFRPGEILVRHGSNV